MNRKQIITALREEQTNLVAKRDQINSQLDQVNAALAAFGVNSKTRVKADGGTTTKRKRVPVERMADNVLAALDTENGQTAMEIAAALDVGESSVYAALKLLASSGKVAAIGSAPAKWVRSELRLRVTT